MVFRVNSKKWGELGAMGHGISRVRQCQEKLNFWERERQSWSSNFSVAFGRQWRCWFKGIQWDEAFSFLFCQKHWIPWVSSSCYTLAIFLIVALILKNIWLAPKYNILIIFFSRGSTCEWTRKCEVIIWYLMFSKTMVSPFSYL